MTETKLIYPFGNYSIVFVKDSEHSTSLACAALLLLLVLTLSLNSFVFISVFFSHLRGNLYSVSVGLISGIAVLDGAFNITSSIVFHASWMELPNYYGVNATKKWCMANASLLQCTGMIYSFVYAGLMYERQAMLPLRNEDIAEGVIRKEGVQKNLKYMMALSVIFSILLTIPVWFGVFTTTLYEQRMSCSPVYVSNQSVTILLAIITILVFWATWIFTIRTGFVTVKKIINERRRLIDLESIARRRVITSDTQLWNQISPTGHPLYILTGLLFASFAISVVPNIITNQVSQFYTNYDYEDFYLPNATIPSDLNLIHTDIFDSIFAWTRHGYGVFSPGLILFMHNEIRKQFRLTFCCFGKDGTPQPLRSVSAFVRDLKRSRANKNVAHYKTPVLFATSEGLHLRTFDGFDGDEPRFVVSFCDVTLEDDANRKINLPNDMLNETFVVKHRNAAIFPGNGFDTSSRSRSRINTIELTLVSENGYSSHSMRNS